MKTVEEKANKYAEEAILALYSDSELMQDFVQKPEKYAKVDFLAGYNEAMKEVKEMKANTQLIAAAPDLLEALMSLMDGVANLPPLVAIGGVLKTEWEQGLKAINKALGK